MNDVFKSAIESVIAGATDGDARILSAEQIGGGCINVAQVCTLDDGRKYFVKTNSQCPVDMFECEAAGLQAIAETGAVAVPAVIGAGYSTAGIFLVLSVVDSGTKPSNYSETLGEQLAQMHRSSAENRDGRFGFEMDNYLGSTPQPNSWSRDWREFWLENRLRFQIETANNNGWATLEFNRLADRLVDRLDELLIGDEPPALIHGDLWSGNHMVGARGEPVLIDPAVYFAHREAEFGMISLFGGLNERFNDAYQATWPLQAGSRERIAIYRLYHLMNHLNLFGKTYLGGCLEIMRRFA